MEGCCTRYAPGPRWTEGKKIDEQIGFPEQLVWWREHAKNARMQILGVPATRPDELFVTWRLKSLDEVQEMVRLSPFVQSEVMVATTLPGLPKT